MKVKHTETPLVRSNPVDWVQYTFKTPNDRKWDAQLIFNTVSNFIQIESEIWRKIFDALVSEWLNASDIYVHLNEFYPNWRWLKEAMNENMRQWFGTAVLDLLMKKALARGAKAMYVFTGKISMQNFLTKYWFKKVDKYLYIKRIQIDS